jgi:hypothetical protein
MLGLILAGCSDSSDSPRNGTDPNGPAEPLSDRAHYILPPGNYGGLDLNENSLDQLPLYDGLTPLRGNITDADIERLYLPQDFQPIGETREEPTPRPGVTIIYDEFGIAHVTGETREDMAYGAGWVTMRDRALLVTLGRWPARVAVADVPGIDAFGLVVSGRTFVPSDATEQLVTDQVQLLIDEFGDEGQQIIDELEAYADGMNAYEAANGLDNPQPYTVNDGIAVTAFIGSIFGAGGGSEATNAEFRSKLVNGLGDGPGQQAWEDVMLFDDPEAPTTINERFDYGPLTGGPVVGSVVIDEGSIISTDPREPTFEVASNEGVDDVFIPAAEAPRDREASNWLLADAPRSVNGTHLGVLGPQLGYYYPEIVMQIHLRAPGVEAQGIAVTGLALYMLIGRTADYAWSLTSAGHDVRDVYAELLCEPDGSEPSRNSLNYLYEGECIPFDIMNAGALNDVPLIYPVSVHGPVIGTATSNGRPVALSRKRSTFGRDGLNLAALKDLTEGDASTPEKFFESANKFGFTFNWGYLNRDNIAFFSSGRLPVRPAGLDRRLPTLGTGEYEWQGFLSQERHPHAAEGPDGLLLNWNNQAAPGFMHGDGNNYGSVHRVETFDQWPDKVDLAGVVGVMNRAATEDVRSPVWPVISEVLRGGDAPSDLAASVIDLLDDWVAEDAPRLDADNDGFNDHAGPTIIDELFEPLAEAVMGEVFGALTPALDDIRNLNGDDGASLMDKDLRTLLGKEVEGPFNLSYCGRGDPQQCRDALWAVVESVSQELSAEYGGAPDTWLKAGATIPYVPGIISERHRATNRSTFQQVLEFAPAPAP